MHLASPYLEPVVQAFPVLSGARLVTGLVEQVEAALGRTGLSPALSTSRAAPTLSLL